MPQISAKDSEFAVATGDNIGAGRRTSNFDVPADDLRDLTITSDPEDDAPFKFSVGDSYTLSYSDGNGTVSEIETVVIRSDPLWSSDQGAVVFQGVDPDHGSIQVVWTPNFDVDAWIDDTLASGRTPGFYTYDTKPATYGHVCFAAGTAIATPHGPRAVERLRPGDEVLTLDGPARRLIWVGAQRLLGVGAAAPVRFAPGVLANTVPLFVSQQHRMLISGPQADLLFGTRQVLAPAKAFVNGTSVRLEPRREVLFVHLLLETHEILFAAGAPAESLFLGDVARTVVAGTHAGEADDGLHLAIPGRRPPAGNMRAARMLLRYREARLLAREIGIVPEAAGTPQRAALLLTA